MSLFTGRFPIPPAPSDTPVLAWDGRHFGPTTALSIASLVLTGALAAASGAFSGAVSVASLTSGTLTPGRITTAGASGLLQDFAGLAIVGTPSATAPSTGTNGPGLIGGVQWSGPDGSGGGFTASTFGNGSALSCNLVAYPCQGTAASPGATISGDQILIALRGHDGANFIGAAGAGAQITLTAGSTWSTSNHDASINFATTPSGSTTRATAFRIDNNQCIVSGANNSVGTFSAGTLRPHIQTGTTSAAIAGIAQVNWVAAATGPTGIFAKSRGNASGTQGVITTGDTLGTMSFQGDDGTNFIEAASVVGVSTGTIGTGQVPGLLRIRTASSAGTMTTGYQMDSTQVSCYVGNGSNATSQALYSGATTTPRIQVFGTSLGLPAALSLAQFQNSTGGGTLYFGKSRSATIGTMTVVTTGDTLGNIDWQGSDGTNFVSAAKIIVTCTGTIGGAQIPGNMVLQTATTGGTLTTALTIDNAQLATFAGGIAIADAKNIACGSSTGNQLGTANTQKIGLWGATPIAQKTGYGTPTGNSQTASFPGATATLLQTSQELAQLLLDLKAAGIIGA